jgi:hypothetical protein
MWLRWTPWRLHDAAGCCLAQRLAERVRPAVREPINALVPACSAASGTQMHTQIITSYCLLPGSAAQTRLSARVAEGMAHSRRSLWTAAMSRRLRPAPIPGLTRMGAGPRFIPICGLGVRIVGQRKRYERSNWR